MNNYKNIGAEECRIFKRLDRKNDEDYIYNDLNTFLEKYGQHIEKRIDFYIFPLNLKPEIAYNYGIKFRDIKISKKGNFKAKKLELKLRFNSNDGVETWAKPISVSIKKIKVLKRVSDDEIKENGFYVILDRLYYKVKVKKIINCLKKTFSEYLKDDQIINYLNIPLGFAITYKNRTQINGEDAMFKLSLFKFEKENEEIKDIKSYYFRSFCNEGKLNFSDIEYIKSKYSNDDFIGGYPELIMKLL